jgi:DNA-directed RNA polymerase subunit RPC12/RpoP
MPRYVRYYEFAPATERVECDACGWAGLGSELGIELFEGLSDLECPKCSARLLVVVYPTAEETREAAAAGDERAQRDLVDLEQREARWRRAKALALARPSQLPHLDGPVDVVWDFDDHGDETLTILRAGDRILWSELAYWEGIDRFVEVATILRKRYKRRLRSITPSPASELYLYGDKLSAPDRVDQINRELASRVRN